MKKNYFGGLAAAAAQRASLESGEEPITDKAVSSVSDTSVGEDASGSANDGAGQSIPDDASQISDPQQFADASGTAVSSESDDSVIVPADSGEQADLDAEFDSTDEEAEEVAGDVAENNDDIEQLTDAAVGLESIAASLEDCLSTGGLDNTGARMLHHAVGAYTQNLGLTVTPVASLESFESGSRMQATSISLENIQEWLRKIWEAIKAAFKRALELITKNKFVVKRRSAALVKSAEDLEKKADEAKGKKVEGKLTIFVPGGWTKVDVENIEKAVVSIETAFNAISRADYHEHVAAKLATKLDETYKTDVNKIDEKIAKLDGENLVEKMRVEVGVKSSNITVIHENKIGDWEAIVDWPAKTDGEGKADEQLRGLNGLKLSVRDKGGKAGDVEITVASPEALKAALVKAKAVSKSIQDIVDKINAAEAIDKADKTIATIEKLELSVAAKSYLTALVTALNYHSSRSGRIVLDAGASAQSDIRNAIKLISKQLDQYK